MYCAGILHELLINPVKVISLLWHHLPLFAVVSSSPSLITRWLICPPQFSFHKIVGDKFTTDNRCYASVQRKECEGKRASLSDHFLNRVTRTYSPAGREGQTVGLRWLCWWADGDQVGWIVNAEQVAELRLAATRKQTQITQGHMPTTNLCTRSCTLSKF